MKQHKCVQYYHKIINVKGKPGKVKRQKLVKKERKK